MILTKRTVLRPLACQDVTDAYVSWFRDEAVIPYIVAATTPPSFAQLQDYVETKRTIPGCWFLGIYVLGRHIGNLKFEPDGVGGHHVGILIGAAEWRGKGIAQEVLEVMCPIVSMNSLQIWLGVKADHLAARLAYEAAGFREVSESDGVVRYEW